VDHRTCDWLIDCLIFICTHIKRTTCTQYQILCMRSQRLSWDYMPKNLGHATWLGIIEITEPRGPYEFWFVVRHGFAQVCYIPSALLSVCCNKLMRLHYFSWKSANRRSGYGAGIWLARVFAGAALPSSEQRRKYWRFLKKNTISICHMCRLHVQNSAMDINFEIFNYIFAKTFIDDVHFQ